MQQLVLTLARSGDIEGAKEILEGSAKLLGAAVREPLRVALERGAEAFDAPVTHNFPLHAELMVSIGRELLEGDDAERAVVAFERARELHPGNLEAITDLGVALSSLERDDEAIDLYSEAIESIAGGELLRFNRGNATRRLGKLDEAVADYRRCLEILPEWNDARVNLVSTLQMRGDLDDAGTELDILESHDAPAELVEMLRENLDEARG